MIYKLYIRKSNNTSIPDSAFKINEDGSITSFVFDEANTDYQQYLKWLEEGGVPVPADE